MLKSSVSVSGTDSDSLLSKALTVKSSACMASTALGPYIKSDPTVSRVVKPEEIRREVGWMT